MQRTFEWDERKAATNLRKHGVAFEDAIAVFDDPAALQFRDDSDEWEERWRLIGLSIHLAVLFVVHTSIEDEDEELIRIISVRKATRHEKDVYEAARAAHGPL